MKDGRSRNKKKILLGRNNILAVTESRRMQQKNYSATTVSQVAVLSQQALVSQFAHFVESQHSVQAFSQASQASQASVELLLQAQDTAANIAAATAIETKNFFIITNN